MYIARNHAIQVPFQLQTKTKRVDQKALLDCGATKCFIHPRAVERLKLITRKLVKPQKVQNVDGTPNKSGEILKAVDLLVNNNGQKASHAFFVTNIGRDDFILGYPFFEASNPNVDWSGGRIEGFTTISSINADAWRPPLKGTNAKTRPQRGYDASLGGRKATRSGFRPESLKQQSPNNSLRQPQTRRNVLGRK